MDKSVRVEKSEDNGVSLVCYNIILADPYYGSINVKIFNFIG